VQELLLNDDQPIRMQTSSDFLQIQIDWLLSAGHMEGEQGSANLWGLGFLAFTPSTLQLEIDFSSMSAWKKMEDATPPASKAA
jgi:hypothetical protein